MRGRQGRHGFRGMTLGTLCDLIWVEIWDDCSPMANQAVYRDIMMRLFIKGEKPHTITYKDASGKTKRLAEPGTYAPERSTMASARALYEQVRKAKQQVAATNEVASPGDAGE